MNAAEEMGNKIPFHTSATGIGSEAYIANRWDPESMRTDKVTVAAWGLWDWGSAAFNAVLVTFIFSVYLTDSVGKSLGESALTPTQWYSLAMAISGVAIAGVAPIMGRRTDIRGTRRKAVRIWTLVTFALMACLYFVRNDAPIWFILGVSIMAVASLTFQFAEVNYYAMLKQVSTPDNVGKVSGYGWSMGYFGGIVLLLACYVGFVKSNGDGTAGLLKLSTEYGFNIRMVAVLAACWLLFFGLPVFFRVPEIRPSGGKTDSFTESYRNLFRDLKGLWHNDRNCIFFLISSAIFRDGLAGVFTYGAILAVTVYELDPGDVLIFGVVANVVSAIGAVVGGWLDDRIGPKPIILACLLLMILDAAILYFVHGPQMFWIFGLILCLFVGPAQSASRTFLSRLSPDGQDGQMFGLYATTGRAVSWLAPLAFGIFAGLFGGDRAGILGIALILAAGALALIRVQDPTRIEP